LPSATPDKEYRVAGGVVVRGGDALLLLNRAAGEMRLPKGHIEPGESRSEAARREVTEETGYSALRILADLGELPVDFQCRGKSIRRWESYFLMELASEEKVPREPKAAEKFTPMWVDASRAAKLLTFGSEVAFLRRALDAARSAEPRKDDP
jgi:8-oxo-dGTP pyrophosphatase MutT (NUDIX family)